MSTAATTTATATSVTTTVSSQAGHSGKPLRTSQCSSGETAIVMTSASNSGLMIDAAERMKTSTTRWRRG